MNTPKTPNTPNTVGHVSSGGSGNNSPTVLRPRNIEDLDVYIRDAKLRKKQRRGGYLVTYIYLYI